MDGSLRQDNWISDEQTASLPELQTPRLNLRALTMSDAAFIAREAGKPAVARMTTMIPSTYPSLAAEGFIMMMNAAVHSRGDRVRIVTSRAGTRLGMIGLHPRDDGSWELGYWFTRIASGVGYATEAGEAVLEEARSLCIGPIQSGHFQDNPQSGRVLMKLGFKPTGEDVDVYSLGRAQKVACTRMTLSASACV